MILPWHTDLFQPGRTVCVVFRASPLIWPTSSGAHHAPRPLCLRATRCTPGGSPRGAMGVGGYNQRVVIPDGVSRVPDLVPQSPRGSPLCAIASAGMTGLVERSVSLKAPLPLFMPSHKPKHARPRQGQLPRVDSLTLHSDLPHEAPPG